MKCIFVTSIFMRGISILVVIAGLSSCTLGPDFKRPAAPDAKHYSTQTPPTSTSSANTIAGEQQHFIENADIPSDWWTLFQSTQINSLIERALKNNPDIESAQASLHQAQEYANAQRGYFYPNLSLSYTPSRNKVAGNLSSAAPGPQANGDNLQQQPPSPTYYNFHVAQLNVGFVPDVFGLNRRQLEAANAQTEMQKLQLEAAHISLASNVFAAALQQAMLQEQCIAMEKIVSSNQEEMDILNSQLKHGYVSGLDVAAQENVLATAKQSLITLKLQLQKNKNLLAALQGNSPDKETPETIQLSELHLPQNIPLTLPSKLIEQRPDIRAAEAQLHIASAQAGIAIANQFPQFTITGAIGGMADTPEWMLKNGGNFFNLSADISQMIFDGGTLRAKSRAAKQGLIQASAQYRSTVITALQNVADTLYTLQSDSDSLAVAAAAEESANRTLRITHKQYAQGLINYQALLNAQEFYELAVINVSQAQASRFADTAALYQVLGGGWWNRAQPETVFNTTDNAEIKF